MNTEQAKQIILHVAGKTQPRWKQYDTTWEDIDEIFISKGYEQGGFHCFKFVPLLEEKGINAIHKLGSILDEYTGTRSYNRAFAGSLDSELYTGMREGSYGEEGWAFYSCVKDYLDNRVGNPGSSYHMQLWRMLVCCNYLKNNYEGSFSFYLKKKYADFKSILTISDAEFLSMSSDEWEQFRMKMKPWKELYGIGENVFDFIMGDTTEADFVKNAYKLDSANEYFLKISGLYKVTGNLERESIINFLADLKLPYTLRQINKGIYTYCSDTEKENYGFCRDTWKCNNCRISGICEKNFYGVNLTKQETKTKEIPCATSKTVLTHKKIQARPIKSSTAKIPQLHRVQSFNELKEVIAIRSRYYPTNYMDLLLLENGEKKIKLPEMLQKFKDHVKDLNNNDFKTLSILKKHIRYRENHDGWIFDHSGDPNDPIVALVDLAK